MREKLNKNLNKEIEMTNFKRNLKSLNNKTGNKIKNQLKDIIADHEKYQKCFFWTQNGNAAQRRQQEFNTELSFNLNGIKYEINQALSISCKNFYYSCDIRKNDKKANIKMIKNLL